MRLGSSSFKHNAKMDAKFSLDHGNISPQLSWAQLPAGTKSLALICDDPDAPVGDWVHWLVWNIPVKLNGLPEGASRVSVLGNKAVIVINQQEYPDISQGVNDFNKLGYGGPCPPTGTHRYFFKLYALDSVLSLTVNITKAKLQAAMEGHILAQAELVGLYSKF